MLVKPQRAFTLRATEAITSGEPVCDTCGGQGNLEVRFRDHYVRAVCPACGGRGIPRSLRDFTYDNVGRSEFKAYRQVAR